MTPNDKPAFLTPQKLGLAILVALALVAVAAAFLMSTASGIQDDKAAQKECQEAAQWHYTEAIKATPDAEYHFWAGAAAEKLATTGGTCTDWDGA